MSEHVINNSNIICPKERKMQISISLNQGGSQSKFRFLHVTLDTQIEKDVNLEEEFLLFGKKIVTWKKLIKFVFVVALGNFSRKAISFPIPWARIYGWLLA